MKEIKFRAWHKDRKSMCDVIELSFKRKEVTLALETEEGEYYWDETEHNFDDVELMQYTGRKDSEGKGIYEGDILQNEHHFKYQVVFKGDCWRCEPIKNNYFKNRFIGNDLKVIGNVYKNQELLED